MKKRTWHRELAGAVVFGATLLGGTLAAQEGGAPRPPTTNEEDTSPQILNYVLLAVLVGAVVGASVLPSKRGHQD